MTIPVLDPWAISGVRYGRLTLSNEDDRYCILTDDGAIPVDQERLATTLDSALVDYAGCDHLLLVDEAVEFVTPGSPEVVGSTFLGGALYACHSPGALYRDGVQVSTFTTASEALVADDFYVCAQNNSGSPSSVSNRVVAGIAAGGSLSATQHAALAAAMVLA